MLRYNEPFNGARFLINKRTKEIHDLQNESSMCHIDEIKEGNIEMLEDKDEMAYICLNKGYNGCYWCNPSYNKESILY